MNKIEEANILEKQYNDILNSITEKDITDLFSEVFEKHPELQVITWNQYIPSFNDGEPCLFGMSDWVACTSDFLESDKEKFGMSVRDLEGEKLSPELENDINNAFKLLSDDICERVLGYDLQIIITRDGISNRYYNCGY